MQLRRPPGEGVANSLVLALAVLSVPWLVDAQQQQNQGRQRYESPHEGISSDVVPTVIEATRVPPQTAQQIETPHIELRRKRTISIDANYINNDGNDANSIVTLAPAPAVRAPHSGSPANAGLSQQVARSPDDWEVEDFVLLATVDGQLWARDRKNGKHRWKLELDGPMIEISHHRHNRSAESDYKQIDDYVWIVEPSSDGTLFVYVPGGSHPGLVSTSLTMKKLVDDMSPYNDYEAGIMYIGEKKTQMITIDAKTGRVIASHGSGRSQFDDNQSCNRPSEFADVDNDECKAGGTLILGRTEYTVNIVHHGIPDGLIATLKYSEWVPNNYDNDLLSQHHETLDSKYVYSRHDGSVFAYDLNDRKDPDRLFNLKFPSPIVRVFDVHRPWGNPNDPELIVLPQPSPPDDDEYFTLHRRSRIFVNQTEKGSWYAMSGRSYPQAIDGPERAPADSPEFWRLGGLRSGSHDDGDVANDKRLKKALVGLHSMTDESAVQHRLTISPPPPNPIPKNATPASSVKPDTPPSEASTILHRVVQLPQVAASSFVDLVQNPLWPIVVMLLFFVYWKDMARWTKKSYKTKVAPILAAKGIIEEVSVSETVKIDTPEVDVELTENTPDVSTSPKQDAQEISPLETAVESRETNSSLPSAASSVPDSTVEETAPVPEKKKTHRGRRGGVKHRKTKDRSNSEDSGTPKNLNNIDEIVQDVKKMGMSPAIEPDAQTIPNGVSDVSGPILRLGSLEVDTDKLIGTGSNGTMVFEGKFDGREVAVKRMLMQFYDIASQETKLLRESDDHQNVIRYYAQQQSGGFLYIALELCPASLSDVIEKPHLHRDLAQSGERDLPNVLYQITNGLSHLHSLRIVHRDLKPQNILVSLTKDGRPRLLVSDFGLCKKLEGEQSSFRATTAHAAGTSGWRAPELLLDDDARDGQTMIDASTHSGNGSGPLNDTMLPARRATRAIDIFSLGLVFFYVLTQGRHPFDCGDRYMREVNIRKGNYNLKPLEVLGDFSYEAMDLIESMIDKDPHRRPTARQVMAHPFFWSAKKRLNFLCDVSDHFEKEPRIPPLGPSKALQTLEEWAPEITHGDFLKPLGKDFVDSLGKQRKYTGSKLLDLLRALRNKKNHYEDMSDGLKEKVGPLPEGYLSFWTRKFPNLLIGSWNVVYEAQWDGEDRFIEYYSPQVAVANA